MSTMIRYCIDICIFTFDACSTATDKVQSYKKTNEYKVQSTKVGINYNEKKVNRILSRHR